MLCFLAATKTLAKIPLTVISLTGSGRPNDEAYVMKEQLRKMVSFKTEDDRLRLAGRS